MLKGENIYLTSIERDDLEQLRYWRNQPECRKYFREYRELSKDMQSKWYEEKVLGDNSTFMFSIRDFHTNELLGCCGLCYVDWVHRHAELSLYIGKDNAYIDEEGNAREACIAILKYGFLELGLQKVWAEVYAFDHHKHDLYISLGFKLDGELRKHYYCDGIWWDSRILSLLSVEFREDGENT